MALQRHLTKTTKSVFPLGLLIEKSQLATCDYFSPSSFSLFPNFHQFAHPFYGATNFSNQRAFN